MNFNIDLTKLTTSVQYLLIGILLLSPIFFLDIYLYHKNFYKTNPIYLSIILSYCLSLGWLVFNSLLGLTFILFLENQKSTSVDKVVGYGNGVAIFFIVLINGLFFVAKDIENFRDFIKTTMILHLVGYVAIILRILTKKFFKKKTSQIEIPFL